MQPWRPGCGCIASCRRSPARPRPRRRAVDVERDVLVRVLRLQEQQLGADQRADLVVDRPGQEDDPLLQQAGVDVEGALAPGGLLHHHRHQIVGVDLDGIAILHGGHLQVGGGRIDKRNRAGLQPARRPAHQSDQDAPARLGRSGGGSRRPGVRLRSGSFASSSGVTVFSSTLASSRTKSTTFSSKSGAAQRLGRPRVLPEELEHLLLLARIAHRLRPHRPGHLVLRHGDAVGPADLRQQQPQPHPPLGDRAVVRLQRLLVLVLVVVVQPPRLRSASRRCQIWLNSCSTMPSGEANFATSASASSNCRFSRSRDSWSYSAWMPLA